jgi:hypothetical protein
VPFCTFPCTVLTYPVPQITELLFKRRERERDRKRRRGRRREGGKEGRKEGRRQRKKDN